MPKEAEASSDKGTRFRYTIYLYRKLAEPLSKYCCKSQIENHLYGPKNQKQKKEEE